MSILACSAGNYWGFRVIMIVGAILSTLTFASGYVLQEIFYFLLIIGVLGGIAAGFVFVAGFLPAGFYFDKKRSIAMGLNSCGSGLGAIILPHATQYFMDYFGWRLTFIFYAGLCSTMIFMGFLIRPLEPVAVIVKPLSSLTTLLKQTTLGDTTSALKLSLFQVPSQPVDATRRPSDVSQSLLLSIYPAISQIVQDTDTISIVVRDTGRQSTICKLHEMTQSRLLQPSASVLLPTVNIEQEAPLQRKIPWYKCGCFRVPQDVLPERPMLRTDLYYTGSLHRLDEYTTKDKDLDYHLHVTKVPTYFEMVQDMTRTYTWWCCKNILQGIKFLLDYKLLKSPTFICLAISGLTNYVAFFLPFLYGKIHLEKTGKGDHATTLVSMIGLGNMVGRIASGLIVVMVPKFGALGTTAVANFISGLSAVCCILFDHIYYQFGCMLVYGTAIGFFAPLRSIIIVDYMGLEKLTSATGMMIFFQGCGSFLGAPLAEGVMLLTQDQNSPYFVCGGALVISSVVLWPMKILHKWENKRKEKRQRTNTE